MNISIEDAVKCLEITNADGVMCSRGTLGYPFLVGEIDYFFQTGYCSQTDPVHEQESWIPRPLLNKQTAVYK